MLDLSGMTAEDRFALERVYEEFQVARVRGREASFVMLLDAKGFPIGLPINIRERDPVPVQAGPAPKKPAKPFDDQATVYDNGEGTVTDDDEEENSADTTATEDAILDVLGMADAPMKAASIARKAGFNFTDHFRQTVYNLVKKGKIAKKDGHTYFLAD